MKRKWRDESDEKMRRIWLEGEVRYWPRKWRRLWRREDEGNRMKVRREERERTRERKGGGGGREKDNDDGGGKNQREGRKREIMKVTVKKKE